MKRRKLSMRDGTNRSSDATSHLRPNTNNPGILCVYSISLLRLGFWSVKCTWFLATVACKVNSLI